jgi:hypothetical protein
VAGGAFRNTPLPVDRWGQAPADHHLGDRRNPRTAAIIRETAPTPLITLMPDWSERKEEVQAQGYRGQRSEEPPEHAALTVAEPIRPDRPQPDLGPKIQHAAMLIEDSLGRTASSMPPHRWRVPQALARKSRRPVLPLKIHHLPKISIMPHLAIPAANFPMEGAATAAG